MLRLPVPINFPIFDGLATQGRLGGAAGRGADVLRNGLMPGMVLLVLLCMAVSHWLVEPLALLSTPLLTLSWLGWLLLGVVLWLVSG